ncbi:MAG: CDP-glycerol glycerophosphotransferase family protein [Candidatus Sungbacteria bacterium]|nr:CDP-glycerol glycerophosphotransferase family protein [Candidatus Sungbacteria bacterium]
MKMVFLAPYDKLDYYRNEFPHERIEFIPLPETRFYPSERLFRFIETASIHSHTVTLLQRTDFVRTKGTKMLAIRVGLYAVRRLLWHMGRFRAWREVIRISYWLLPSSTFSEALATWKPDLVYCSSMMYTDFRLLKEAKKQGYRTLGMILSWDNLHSKTMLRVRPDNLIVYTKDTVEQVVRYADYPRNKMHITGIPQYDRYFRKTGIVSRDEFMKTIGGDPAKKLIVYAVSGKSGLHIDLGIVRMLREAIDAREITDNVEILMRAYPRHDFSPEKIRYITHDLRCLIKPAMAHIGSGRDSWEFDEDTLSFLTNTLAHADVVVALYTTFFIEAAVFDKPLVAVGFDEREASYEDSAKRFFEWDHLRELYSLGGISKVESRKELIDAINTSLTAPSHLHDGRMRMVERQSQFTDGMSGERVARVILNVLSL